jgi:fucose 4-O-acetylase-like acetyltransferase
MKNNYIAIAKALGIMLMVVGHSGCPDYLYRFIYMFHMPLFFFCSGFLMKPAEKFVDVRKFVFRRFKGLYWPYVKWSLLFLLFHNFFLSWKLYDPDYINYYSRSDFIDRFLHIVFTMTGHDQLADPFWFFKQLLLSSILVFVVEYALRSFRSKLKYLIVFLVLLSLTIISKFYGWGLPVIWNLSIIFLSACFFFLGYIYKRFELKSIPRYLGFLALMILILGVYLYDDYLDMLWYTWKNVTLYIVMALVGVFMALSFSQILERTPFNHILYYIGNHTMIIFLLHLLIFKIVSLLKIFIYHMPYNQLADFKVIQEYNDFFWVIYSIVGVSLPLVLERIVYKFKNCLVP